MKLKFAVITGLVVVVLTLAACMTMYPVGTVMMGGINSPYGRIYTFEEYLTEYPSDKQLAEKLKLDPRGKFVRFSPYNDVFGGGSHNYAYVPPELAQKIKKGDIVKMVGGGTKVVGSEKRVTFNTVTELNPPGCEWKGWSRYVSAQTVYCNGKDSMVTLPENTK